MEAKLLLLKTLAHYLCWYLDADKSHGCAGNSLVRQLSVIGWMAEEHDPKFAVLTDVYMHGALLAAQGQPGFLTQLLVDTGLEEHWRQQNTTDEKREATYNKWLESFGILTITMKATIE